MDAKQCTKCGVQQPLDNFGLHKSTKDGLHSHCRPCRAAYSRAYYQANKSRILVDTKAYQEANKEALRLRSKEYYERNRELYIERRKQWRLDNPERQRLANKNYYDRTRDERLERSKKWREDNKEYMFEYHKRWREENPDKRRAAHVRRKALQKGAKGDVSASVIYQMIEDQHGLCAYCESPLFGRFHVDHMIPLSRGGLHDWTNLAITCPECNMSKRTKTTEEFINWRSRL